MRPLRCVYFDLLGPGAILANCWSTLTSECCMSLFRVGTNFLIVGWLIQPTDSSGCGIPPPGCLFFQHHHLWLWIDSALSGGIVLQIAFGLQCCQYNLIENIGSAEQKIPDFVALWILNFWIPQKFFQQAQKQEQQAYDNQWQIRSCCSNILN